MHVVYTTEPAPDAWAASVFLAGPSPRSFTRRPSWRPEALAELARRGFGGVVFVPEGADGHWPDDGSASMRWELAAMQLADVIAFWVPRHLDEMPGFTTNVELGSWIRSPKVVLGHPPDAPKMRYLDALLDEWHRRRPATTLTDTLDQALQQLGEGAIRRGAERHVPLPLWRRPSFRAWLADLRAAGQSLIEARVAWSRPRPEDPTLAIVSLRTSAAPSLRMLVFPPEGPPLDLSPE